MLGSIELWFSCWFDNNNNNNNKDSNKNPDISFSKPKLVFDTEDKVLFVEAQPPNTQVCLSVSPSVCLPVLMSVRLFQLTF